MPPKSPEIVIRLGSHAEKEYVLKLMRFLDGLIVGANLFEATPGATASLLLSVGGKNTRVYVDPMTYAYGAYIDPETSKVRSDLDWIKSDQIRKDRAGRKRTVRDFKRSYRVLAESLGWPLGEAVQNSRAVSPDMLNEEGLLARFCGSVTDYQLNRFAREFEQDEELKAFIENMPQPAAVFAPYFYVEPTRTNELLELNLKLMTTTTRLGVGVPVHGVLCADVQHLSDAGVRSRLLEALPRTGVVGVWLWFSRFFEESATTEVLKGYRDLVRGLADSVEVHAMHGGFFSLALSKYGIRGVSHGIGYGEQKDVVPVIGQSTPTVRYYLPALARRLGVPDVERAFDALRIRTPEDFHKKVCGCAVCKGVVSSSLDEFSSFGDVHFSHPTARRLAQTPAAAKRCRFHFLLARLQEREDIRKLSGSAIVERLKTAAETWGTQPSLRALSGHLTRWADVLGGK
ncbi:MAG: hypothetical protein ABSD47_10180 [Candidatus Methylomirabilota bacterium]|jgi:hypothetical protein